MIGVERGDDDFADIAVRDRIAGDRMRTSCLKKLESKVCSDLNMAG
jgi:hypothetical protein